MLEISNNPIQIDTDAWKSYQKISIPKAQNRFRNWLLMLLIAGTIILFLPWTQNINAKGEVTMLSPQDRPQDIEAIIAGKIEKWYVNEGQLVKKGDTILKISEIKSEYFDPDLIDRTRNQVAAKENAIKTYSSKSEALERQIGATRNELKSKLEQLRNKKAQMLLKIESDKNDLDAAELDNRKKAICAYRRNVQGRIKIAFRIRE